MSAERCESETCRKPFNVYEYRMGMPGTEEKEDITCPYCGHTIQRTSNGVWMTSKLTEEQQKDFEEGKLK